jgi:hypothetical protein
MMACSVNEGPADYEETSDELSEAPRRNPAHTSVSNVIMTFHRANITTFVCASPLITASNCYIARLDPGIGTFLRPSCSIKSRSLRTV